MEKKLINEFSLGRCEGTFDTFKPKKLIIIGAGAIIDSWKPLEKAFLNATNIDKVNTDVYSSSNKNFQIASYLGQLVHTCHANAITKMKIDGATNKEIMAEVKKLDGGFFSFIDAICYQYCEVEFNLNKESNYVENEIDDNTGIIVLNWDETIWGKKSIYKNVIQIHGRISIPETLILPMETSVEKIYFDEKTNQYNMDIKDRNSLSTAHSIAYDWMCSAERVISWGVGYNIYDSEFHSLIESAYYNKTENDRLREVININTDLKNDYSISRLMNIPINRIKNYFKNSVYASIV